jgi:hypothetical protein
MLLINDAKDSMTLTGSRYSTLLWTTPLAYLAPCCIFTVRLLCCSTRTGPPPWWTTPPAYLLQVETYLRTLVTSIDSVSLIHHTVVEIAAKIHEPSMQFPRCNCRVLYPRVSSLYETDDRSRMDGGCQNWVHHDALYNFKIYYQTFLYNFGGFSTLCCGFESSRKTSLA